MKTRSILALALIAAPMALRAQDARLTARLDARARADVERLIDSVRSAGIPTEPLVDRALEGASKHAEPARIVAAVRRLAGELSVARGALGASSGTAELVAGASALRAGVAPTMLARLRQDRPGTALAVPLAVLSELVARGVPADTASAAVVALTTAGVADEQLVAFRRDVERDIAVGAPPAAATSVRAAGVAEASAPRSVTTGDVLQTNSAARPPRRRRP